jgi:XTP/dITP diphosphohydrolase
MSLSEKPCLVFATGNKHKFDEIRHVMGSRVILQSLADIGFTGEIPEETHSIEGNAAQKALFIFKKYGIDCFADDTGLEINSLDGEPGVLSARYAGKDCTFEDNMNKVLLKLAGITDRRARFRTVIALVENGNLRYFEGEIRGTIILEMRGTMGFGYDPIFQPEGSDLTFAEMSLADKNRISHRALAVNQLIQYFSRNSPVL